MTKKHKGRSKTLIKLKPETILSVLGLLFGYLEYILDLRPKLAFIGLYGLGFSDCLVIVFSVLLLIVVFKNASAIT